MKKYFLYEFKKHLWTLIILTAVCSFIYIVEASSMRLYWEYQGGDGGIYETAYNYPPLNTIFWCLIFLLFIVPTIVYSFKMHKRSVDGYYSLPLRKEKLYLVSTLVGLILVLVPFTVAYWGGFLALLVRPENPYKMWYFVPTYFAGVCFAIFLYGINAFVFTRANRTSDGVIFMIAYALVGMIAYEYLDSVCYSDAIRFNYSVQSAFTFAGGMMEVVQGMCQKIVGDVANFDYVGLWFATSIAGGTLGYGLLFRLLPYEKGENAEQNSDSWFGYRVLIPVYIALLFGLNGDYPASFISILVAGLIATIVYKRTFRLKWKDCLLLGSGTLAGIVLMLMAI